MTDFPSVVKAGWKDYAVKEWSPVSASEAKRYGETGHLTQEIKVDRSFGERQAASTLLHELFHVVWYLYNVRDEDNEERTVTQLADGMSGLIRDNPDAFAWILENLR